MRDRQPTKVLENGALRYGVYDETGALLRYEYLALEDAPSDVGTDLSKANLLTDDTEAALFGSAADRTVNDAFAGIAGQLKLIMSDTASITVTLKDSAGTAIPGVLVQGILSENGQAVYSNDSGVVSGYIAEGSQTIKVTGYADIVDYTETISVTKGTSITKTITLTTRNFLKITSSQSVKFSGNVETVDVTVVGGGGGGGKAAAPQSEHAAGGGGGGGGNCVEETDISIISEQAYPIIIGSGGAGATSSNPGSSGGASSAFGVSASGGNPGGNATTTNSYTTGGIGGSGSGVGGTGGKANRVFQSNGYSNIEFTAPTDGSNGTQYVYSSFTETAPCGGGGSGGGGNNSYPSSKYGGSGGSPAGGYGANLYAATNGTNGMGGGGGGDSAYWDSDDDDSYYSSLKSGGSGGSGCVAIRMHLRSAA